MKETMMCRAYNLPDGSYIEARVYEGDENEFRTLDVSWVKNDGTSQVLCCIDYEAEKGLRTLAYDDECDDPVFERVVSLFTGGN